LTWEEQAICGWAKELEVGGLLLVAATVVLILSTVSQRKARYLGAGNFSGVLAGLGDP